MNDSLLNVLLFAFFGFSFLACGLCITVCFLLLYLYSCFQSRPIDVREGDLWSSSYHSNVSSYHSNVEDSRGSWKNNKKILEQSYL